jgi:hypothetical protein
MIEAMPSTTKKAISNSVSDTAPVTRPRQQHAADQNGERRRDERPPEARRRAHHPGGVEPDRAGDQEQPAEHQRHRQRRQRRHDHGDAAEDQQHDAFDQKQLPVFAQRGLDRSLGFIETAGIDGHGNLHMVDA